MTVNPQTMEPTEHPKYQSNCGLGGICPNYGVNLFWCYASLLKFTRRWGVLPALEQGWLKSWEQVLA